MTQANNRKPTKTVLTLEQVRYLLQDRRASVISEATGLCAATIVRAKGEGVNSDSVPSYRTVEILSDYLLSRGDLTNM